MDDKPTIKDIADRLGVTPNTVSKALRGKPRVSEQLRQSILDTAAEIGYVPNRAAKALSTHPIKIGIVQPREPREFVEYMERGWRDGLAVCAEYKLRLSHYVYNRLGDGKMAGEMLQKACADGVDGIIAHLGFTSAAYADTLQGIVRSGMPLLMLVSGMECEGVLGRIQLNSQAAGALAAEFIAKTAGANQSAAVFVSNKDFRTHAECVDGFVDSANRRGLQFVGAYEAFEDSEIAYLLTGRIMREYPNLGGIYVSSYNSVGVSRWFQDHPDTLKPVIIGHDLYPAVVENLKAGRLDATLFQNQAKQARNSVIYMVEYLNGLRSAENCTELIMPQLLLSSHLEYAEELYNR